jgi:hypothetical protein
MPKVVSDNKLVFGIVFGFAVCWLMNNNLVEGGPGDEPAPQGAISGHEGGGIDIDALTAQATRLRAPQGAISGHEGGGIDIDALTAQATRLRADSPPVDQFRERCLDETVSRSTEEKNLCIQLACCPDPPASGDPNDQREIGAGRLSGAAATTCTDVAQANTDPSSCSDGTSGDRAACERAGGKWSDEFVRVFGNVLISCGH